ncbi:MAG: hypothetical protein ACTHQQ_12895 [Solirubrobacteraceae bacterium]
MESTDPALAQAGSPRVLRGVSTILRQRLLGGGTDGNEELTAATGLILIVLLLVLGVTILRVRQLISVHLFVGLVLIGPVALKMASTGYRFVRYYAGSDSYREKGAPPSVLRAIAPIIVVTTILVFLSGLLLLFGGASSRDQYLELHKVSFIVWVVFTGIHVLAHLPEMRTALRAVPSRFGGEITPGASGRNLALIGVLVGGVVLALVLIPEFSSWTAAGAIPNHHHH